MHFTASAKASSALQPLLMMTPDQDLGLTFSCCQAGANLARHSSAIVNEIQSLTIDSKFYRIRNLGDEKHILSFARHANKVTVRHFFLRKLDYFNRAFGHPQ